MRLLSIIVICVAVCMACSRSEGNKQYAQFEKSSDFSEVAEAKADTLETPLIARVLQILSADSIVRVHTEGTPMWVYALNSENLSVVDSACRKGEGPEEYGNVAISALKGTDDLLVVDNRKMKWYRVSHDGIKESGNTGHFIVSDLHEIDFPLVGYVDMRSDGLRLRIRDLQTGIETDSLMIPNVDMNGESHNDNFVWDYDKASRQFVLAFTEQNKLLVGGIENGKIDGITLFTGDSQPNHIYYTDVKIDGDRLLALTQSNVNLDTFEGNSSIEVYSFDGKPVSKTELPVMAQAMTVDNVKSRVILISATDDNLYSVKK